MNEITKLKIPKLEIPETEIQEIDLIRVAEAVVSKEYKMDRLEFIDGFFGIFHHQVLYLNELLAESKNRAIKYANTLDEDSDEGLLQKIQLIGFLSWMDERDKYCDGLKVLNNYLYECLIDEFTNLEPLFEEDPYKLESILYISSNDDKPIYRTKLDFTLNNRLPLCELEIRDVEELKQSPEIDILKKSNTANVYLATTKSNILNVELMTVGLAHKLQDKFEKDNPHINVIKSNQGLTSKPKNPGNMSGMYR